MQQAGSEYMGAGLKAVGRREQKGAAGRAGARSASVSEKARLVLAQFHSLANSCKRLMNGTLQMRVLASGANAGCSSRFVPSLDAGQEWGLEGQ